MGKRPPAGKAAIGQCLLDPVGHVRQARPRLAGDAGGVAPGGEGGLGEDHVGVVSGVAVAGPIAHEEHHAAGCLVAPHALTLAGAAHEAGRVAVREGHARAAVPEDRGVGGDGQVGQSEASQHALDVEAHAVADDLERGAVIEHDAHELVERLVKGDGVDLAVQHLRSPAATPPCPRR